MEFLGYVAVGGTIDIYFTTHAQTGAAVAPSSAFEAADVRVYKNNSATQRSSEAGYTMTSPFDSVTGLHHIRIDVSDNTDAGFYAADNRYTVILVPDETVDTLAVVRVLGQFVIGVPLVNVTQFGGTAGTFSGGRPEVNASHAAGTAWNSGAIGAATLAGDTIAAAKIAAGAITAAKFAAGAIDAAAIATDAIDADAIKADAVTEIQAGLATAAALDAVDNFIDTEIGTIITHLTDIKGATFSGATDSLEAIRDRGDAAWITATGFSTHTAADVWSAATRTLTAGTNIQLPANGLANVVAWTVAITGNLSGSVGSVTGNVGGSVASVVAGVIVTTNNDKAGYSLAASGADAVLVDGKTLPVAVAIVAGVVAGKISGAGTGTETFLGLDGTTTRATVTVDANGNRTAVTY